MMRHRRREGLGLLLLIGQLMRVGLDRIPPTTLGTIAINVAIYLKVLDPYIRMYFRSPTIKNICASTYSVWYQGDWPRLALAAWFHLDDWHLYFNMVSFLWKGLSLERRFGTFYFMYLIAVFSLLTNATMIGLNMALAEVLDDDSYIVSCAAGFSGVIFALKVLTTHYTPAGTQYVMGFPVPSRYACWAELVLIQLLVPRASFTGHLAGILVGLAFVKGPLKSILDIVPSILTPRQGYQGAGRPGRATYNYRAGTTGRGGATGPDQPRGYEYAGGMSEEEQMQEAIRASLQTGGTGHPPAPPMPAHPGPSTSAYPPTPSAPPYEERPNGPRLYPDLGDLAQDSGQRSQGPGRLDDDELRRRRLARLDR
ncbi:rhomboid-related protein 4-like [Patiria miniata]|uniref:Peptidase S54 rhomboid domain-containing protein n=1 Tax=Patiria miniata TaxID=46514 RepID=A0A913ZI95_PATMI|nr:rhomboid-related protein 4-like [Patiria miniata]